MLLKTIKYWQEIMRIGETPIPKCGFTLRKEISTDGSNSVGEADFHREA